MSAAVQKLKKIAKKFPNSPGVYFWLDKNRSPLYIGRAGSLRKRVLSYFAAPLRQGFAGQSKTTEMVSQARGLKFQKTDTLLEAIVLEANLIKKFWPKYNVRDKDNRSFIYLVITDESFPRLLIVRGRELERYSSFLKGGGRRSEDLNPSPAKAGAPFRKGRINAKAVFGPYQSYYVLRTVLGLVRKIFPFSTCNPPRQSRKSLRNWIASPALAMTEENRKAVNKPCFYYQIGLCPGVCIGAISQKEYGKIIRNLILFFRGEKKRLIKNLKRDNPAAIKALQHIQDVALLTESDFSSKVSGQMSQVRRIEGYDISHLSGREPVGAMVVFENGEADTSQYRLFKIKGSPSSPLARSEFLTLRNSDDLVMLEEILERRLNHSEWHLPDIVFVDGGVNQVRRALKVLKSRNLEVPVVGLSKSGQHAASAYASDKLVIANAKKVGKELLIASKKLFQEVRNEAHRFVIGFQRKRRRKSFI